MQVLKHLMKITADFLGHTQVMVLVLIYPRRHHHPLYYSFSSSSPSSHIMVVCEGEQSGDRGARQVQLRSAPSYCGRLQERGAQGRACAGGAHSCSGMVPARARVHICVVHACVS